MELARLNQLLEKYWDGKLTDSEEIAFKGELRLNKERLKGDLKDLSEWFEANEKVKEGLVLDDAFEDELFGKIHQGVSPKNQWSWWKVAAAILVIITIGYTSIIFSGKDSTLTTETAFENSQNDPEKAFAETKATLQLIASMMNNGKDHLSQLELIEVAQDKIKKTVKTEKKKNS